MVGSIKIHLIAFSVILNFDFCAHISERGEWRKRRIDGKGQSAVVFVPTTESMCWTACWDGVLRGYAVTKHGFVLASELRGKANAIAFGNGDSFWRRKNGVMAVAGKDNTISQEAVVEESCSRTDSSFASSSACSGAVQYIEKREQHAIMSGAQRGNVAMHH